MQRLRDFARSLFRPKQQPVTDFQWTTAQQREALQRGWGLFHDSDDIQLQAWGEDPHNHFKDDIQAWACVHLMAEHGDELSYCAMRYLEQESPQEYALIARTLHHKIAA